ncbi:uncharacterized protein ColSpa_01401 [Colletotrichum spaethianum]|uniref:Uncharacterized protein n=1 Tax=Colletotrichum spaethianum TaxID=700344 RepID=A0AA37L6U2_9PEZI|nr:uncharacterized protein ColSpa_01401 [Colletotrichum spaethianum]GKT41220.1 hypothetical protein ColSpa_01401 [Colletotrichum spaethianum]
MESRDSSPARPGAREKDADFDLHVDHGTSSHDPEEASKSLLNPHPTDRDRKRCFTTSYTRLVVIVLVSLLLGALTSLGLTTLVSHIHKISSTTAHRNDNTLASPSHDPQSSVKFLHPAPCGTTPSEARASGCLFDLISFNWLPPACHDAELAAQFEEELREAGQLSWYEDMQRTKPLSRDQIMTGEHSGIYVSLGYHLRHCTAMWRRMHRALIQGGGGLGRVDGYIWSYHHTRHCEEMLLAGHNGSAAGELFTTEVRIKYPDCGVVMEA